MGVTRGRGRHGGPHVSRRAGVERLAQGDQHLEDGAPEQRHEIGPTHLRPVYRTDLGRLGGEPSGEGAKDVVVSMTFRLCAGPERDGNKFLQQSAAPALPRLDRVTYGRGRYPASEPRDSPEIDVNEAGVLQKGFDASRIWPPPVRTVPAQFCTGMMAHGGTWRLPLSKWVSKTSHSSASEATAFKEFASRRDRPVMAGPGDPPAA